MTNLPTQIEAFEKALITGDLSKLSEEQRLSYYKKTCESLGLNQLTKPFDYINLNGKLVLYCTKSATEQLRTIHKVSLNITARDKFDDVYVVTARAKTPDGREDEATGAVNIARLQGDALANAFMKAETKAKRRVTLSICGLGMLDETEIETIAHARPMSEDRQIPVVTNSKPQTILERVKAGTVPTYTVPFGGASVKGKALDEIYAEFGYERLKKYLNTIKNKDVKVLTNNEKVFIIQCDLFLIDKQFEDERAEEDDPMPDDPPAALANL